MKNREQQRRENGITLVALVVTIAIIMILASITINAVLGDNGLIRQAQKTKDMTNDYMSKEESDMNKLLQEHANLMAEDEELNTPFEPGPTDPPEGGGTEMSDMTNGIIEIMWLDGTSYNVSDTPNAPVTKTISNGTMELVKFDSSSQTWVSGTEYSYTAGTGSSDNTSSKWANAKVTINNVDSYFVWIPRYAYRIIYFDSAESKKAYQEGTLTEADAVAQGKIIGYSDSRGIVDAQGKKIESVASTTKTKVSEDYFMVHPAFINDLDAGGWDSELPGIWVGKYETSGTTSQLKVQPGVSSLRSQKIGTFYTAGIGYSNGLQSHMLKNSEWGAVAYLTESKYGRNGTEVTRNNNGTTYYTGGGSGTAYITNVSQSSTGNVYGIYDLSGNAYEYVAGYYNGSDVNTGYLNFGSTFASVGGSSTKYATAYTGTILSIDYKYGDATYETDAWHSNIANLVGSLSPFFVCGGMYNSTHAGVFCVVGYYRRQHVRLLLFSSCPSSVMRNLPSEQYKKFTAKL